MSVKHKVDAIAESINGQLIENESNSSSLSLLNDSNSLTHLKMANIVIDVCNGRIRWVSKWKCWVMLNQSLLWEVVDENEIKRIIIDCINHLRSAEYSVIALGKAPRLRELKNLERAESAGFINGTESVLKSVAGISIPYTAFDADPLLVGMNEGCLYNLKNNTVRSIEPNDYLMKHIYANFNNESKCPLWEKSILQWCNGDKELVTFLQTFCGYSLSGLTSFQGFLFLAGEGNNGKSVFVKVISTLIGKYAASMQSESLMLQNKSAKDASEDLVRLLGIRFASAQEVSEGKFFDENLIKKMTGGDTITARNLYESSIEFTPNLKLVISGNHKPIVKGTDNGFWRRMHLIPFNAKIDKPDAHLTEKLFNEMSGILNWCLVGWKRFQLEGLVVPEIIKRESNSYREIMDVLAQWKNECVIEKNGNKVPANLVYLSYKKWAEFNGHHPMTSSSFGRNVKRLLGDPKRNNKGMYYEGYDLIKVAIHE